jgi:hypothetical protein
MGHHNISPAKIDHWQPPQQAFIDTTHQRRIVPLHGY